MTILFVFGMRRRILCGDSNDPLLLLKGMKVPTAAPKSQLEAMNDRIEVRNHVVLAVVCVQCTGCGKAYYFDCRR